MYNDPYTDNYIDYVAYLPSDGYIALNSGNEGGYYDTMGNEVIPVGTFEAVRPVKNGMAWVKDKETGLWGIIRFLDNNSTDELNATTENVSSVQWQEMYRDALKQLVSDNWSMEDIDSWKGSRFCLLYFTNDDVPDLFVAHDSSYHADAKIYSIVGGELKCSDVTVNYGSIAVNYDDKLMYVNMNTSALPEPCYYIFVNGQLAETIYDDIEEETMEWEIISPYEEDNKLTDADINRVLGLQTTP
jgi:hypothetical protein